MGIKQQKSDDRCNQELLGNAYGGAGVPADWWTSGSDERWSVYGDSKVRFLRAKDLVRTRARQD